jgi:hypothetical protein
MSITLKGIVKFVHHEKGYVEIEYQPKGVGKSKTINGQVDKATQEKLIEERIIKKVHSFYIGDTVQFITKLSDRGDKMIAAQIQYLHNEALDVMLNKAKTNNAFLGYIKQVGEQFFVKEIDSYRFFQLEISPWRMPFTEKEMNAPVEFMLNHLQRKEKATAELLRNEYIPEFYTAEKHFISKKPVTGKVYKVTEHGIYLSLLNDAIRAKIENDFPAKIDDNIEIQITYLSPLKIAVKRVQH